MSAKTPRPRRRRTLTAQLASVVLGFEAIIVFLGGLAIFGLGALPASIPDWWGVVAGSVVALAMLLTAGFVGTRSGIIVGWVLQGIVASGAFLVPALLIVAVVFGGMWAFATLQGPRIEARSSAPEGE